MLFTFFILFIAALIHLCSLWPQRNAFNQWHTHSLHFLFFSYTQIFCLSSATFNKLFSFTIQIPEYYFMIETILLYKIKMSALMKCIEIIIRFLQWIFRSFLLKISFNLEINKIFYDNFFFSNLMPIHYSASCNYI